MARRVLAVIREGLVASAALRASGSRMSPRSSALNAAVISRSHWSTGNFSQRLRRRIRFIRSNRLWVALVNWRVLPAAGSDRSSG
ncbi:hypothetical protein D3C84_342080 [compost metagenome]